MEERRLFGGRLLRSHKFSKAEIARGLGVSRATVTAWEQQLRAGGLRALRSRKASGRPPKLSREQQKRLLRLLKKGARQAGFPSDRWTLPRIQKLIKREFKVVYAVKYLSRLLHQLDWTSQIPLPRAQERDEALIRAWLEKDWPRIKKKARRHGITCVFFDEFGLSFQERLDTTWAPRGQRPVLRRVESERRGISTAVGLTLAGKIYKRHFEGGMDSDDVVQTLEHVLRVLPDGFVLIWDRASIHTSHRTQDFLAAHRGIIEEPLPPYAPELNPEEYCHGNVKRHRKNATPDTTQEVCEMLDTGFARLRHRRDLLLHCFHAAGLRVRQLL